MRETVRETQKRRPPPGRPFASVAYTDAMSATQPRDGANPRSMDRVETQPIWFQASAISATMAWA